MNNHPVNPKRLNQGSVAERLLSALPRFEANFNLHPEVMPWNKKKILRYQQNPQRFWGPGTRDKNKYVFYLYLLLINIFVKDVGIQNALCTPSTRVAVTES